MKLSLALCGLAAVMILPTAGFGGTLSWNFLNDVPSGSTGVNVASPHSFTDTNGDVTPITASIALTHNRHNQLFEKNEPGDEFGLGIYGLAENEIDTKSAIKLDLSSVLALDPTSISITLESVQKGEGGFISYGGTPTGFDVSDENAHTLDLTTLLADGGFIDVTATSGNVLIGNVTAITPGSAVPEPANAALVGLGLLAAIGCIGTRRKFLAANRQS
ncbi:MAG: PEP-CTERM sorting domain-containing protein [Bryobacteraceae bacterium]